jgi:hypothetical protein
LEAAARNFQVSNYLSVAGMDVVSEDAGAHGIQDIEESSSRGVEVHGGHEQLRVWSDQRRGY